MKKQVLFSQEHTTLGLRSFGLMLISAFVLVACSTPKNPAPIRDNSSGRKAQQATIAKTTPVTSSKVAVKSDSIKETKSQAKDQQAKETQKETQKEAKSTSKSEDKAEKLEKSEKVEKAEVKKDNTVPDSSLKLSKPANGQTIGNFDGNTNKGIDISGKSGDPIMAAADGKVVYAGNSLRGYGNLVIVKHDNTYLTAYAHNKNLLVKEGETVKRGQKIAEMGNTEADRVKLHFELRRNGKPIDPTNYLQ